MNSNIKQDNSLFEPGHNNMREYAKTGFIFSAAAQGTRIVTQFLSVVILARLLDPADFGIIAKVYPIYLFALLFHDLGLSQSTLQRPSLNHGQVNTFFWINSGIGLALSLILFASSPVVGWFYHDERATTLVMAMSSLIFLSGLGNQHGALMQRKMMFGSQATLNIVGAIGALITSIIWAALFHNYWALFAGMAVGTIVPSLGVWLVVRWRPDRPSFVPETYEMLKYGMGFTSGNLVGFISGNITNVVMGRFFGDHLLGIYDRASRLLYAPLQQLIWPISGVVVPILYRLHSDNDHYRRTFLRALGSISFAILPGIIWVVVAANEFIGAFLGPKWSETAPVFALLSFLTIPQLINTCAGWLILTQGRSREYAGWSIFSALFSAAALALGLPHGILGVALSSVVSQMALTPIYWWFACRRGPVSVLNIMSTLMPYVVAAGCAVPVLYGLRLALAPLAKIQTVCIGGTLSYFICGLVVMIFPKGRSALLKDVTFSLDIVNSFIQRVVSLRKQA